MTIAPGLGIAERHAARRPRDRAIIIDPWWKRAGHRITVNHYAVGRRDMSVRRFSPACCSLLLGAAAPARNLGLPVDPGEARCLGFAVTVARA
jgi:hypothetical protein